jgi:dihydrodipicolinate synthase/N-acetylneuraminate lyase
MSAHCIRGVLVAAITPRQSSGVAIDFGAALELVDFFETHGVDGITLLGSTGEFLHFEPEERTRLVALVSRRSHVPVLVNVSHSTLDGAVRLGREAMDSGAAGVLIMPPYYFRYSQASIRAYCLEFAAQVKAPTYLYNIPWFTNELQLETSLDLLRTGAFAGIKDSGGKWDHFVELQKVASVLVGSDTMYSRTCGAGAVGSISGLASAVPELMVAIDRRARAGLDTSAQDALLKDFSDRVLSFPLPIALKEAAAVRGISVGPHATPLGPDERRALDEFREWFREWLLDAQAEFA